MWREITKTDTPQLAFFGAQMRYRALSAGSPVQMRAPDAKFTSVVGEILEDGRPALGTLMLYALFGLLGFTTPAKCRSEHWPLEGKTHG